MATTFKTLTANDIVNTRTLLHEAIPLTGTISSGTYSDENIKTFSHGMFQSVYDYPYLSSSANHIFDITQGYASDSSLSGTSAAHTQNAKKINIYNQMAQVLVGHDVDGNIQNFDQDGNIAAGGTKMKEVFFLNFARLLSKDEIKKDSFRMSILTGGTPDNRGSSTFTRTIGDYGASTSYLVNSPAGEYGILYTSSAAANINSGCGLIYYQAGVAVITGGVFSGNLENGAEPWITHTNTEQGTILGYNTPSGRYDYMATASSISTFGDTIRNRISNISFNNTVELNSTVYFCRVNHNEFNYSSNPTYLSSSGQLRVKNASSDSPVAYITTVGLYSSDNELLAVAKLSEPLKKDPNTELTIRVRLDY
tara:strand:- start:107 stop:1204 length:1098 start_codon:yes stop_codon:yes gene_type:complete